MDVPSLSCARPCRAARRLALAAMSGSGPLREEVAHDAKSNTLHAMAKRISRHFPQVLMGRDTCSAGTWHLSAQLLPWAG